jgi:hypothetical protein
MENVQLADLVPFAAVGSLFLLRDYNTAPSDHALALRIIDPKAALFQSRGDGVRGSPPSGVIVRMDNSSKSWEL